MAGFFKNNPASTQVGSEDATESQISQDALTQTDTASGFFQGSPDQTTINAYTADALASKNAAETAKTAAETAQAASETAKTAAETAETNSETAETNSAASATQSASSASQSAASATQSASSASQSATSATSSAASATTATTQASNASTSATSAASSATSASTSATNAASSASAASASKDAALAALDNFDDRYLGQKTSDPTVDNDGNALVSGALYFNSSSNVMKVYSGSSWLAAYADVSGAALTANNLSDLANAATARTNLGLGTAATTASTAYATAAQGATADAALAASAVSTFGGTLIDDANAAAARTTLGLGSAATTASTAYATAAQGTTADNALAASAVSTFGGTLIDDADAAAARTTLGLGSAATTDASAYATAAQADQTVSLTGSGGTSVSGTYPNFTISSAASIDGTTINPAAVQIGGTGVIDSSRNLTNISAITSTGLITADRFLSGVGSVASPAYQVGDTNSGFYDSGSNTVGVTLNGVLEYDFQPTKLDMKGNQLDNVGNLQVDVSANDGVLITSTDSSANTAFTGVMIDHNASGSTTLTGDRGHIALQVDMDSSATGGDTSNEHRLTGVQAHVKATGDSDLIHGGSFTAEAEHSAGQVSALYGVYGSAMADLAGSALLSNAYAGFFYAQSTSAAGTTPSGLFGLYGKAELQAGNDTDWTQVLGGYFEVEFETSGTATTVDTAYVIRGLFDQNSTDTTVTNGYLINLAYSGTANITNRYGIYLTGATQNHIAGTIQGSDGDLTRVGYGFISDINTGMFSPANHQVALAVNGSQELTVSDGLVTVNRILTGLGSAASPAFQVGDSNTGFYDSGADTIGVSCNGTLQYNFTSTTLDMTANTITNNGGIAMNANTVLSIGTSPGDAFNTDAAIRIGDTGNSYLQIITENDHQCGVLLGDEDDDFTGGMIYNNSSNQLNLSANNANQLTLSNGSAVFTAGAIDIPSQIRHAGDTDTYIQFHAANQFRVVTGGTERFEVNQGTATIAGTLNVRAAIDLADNDILRLGSGDDAELFTNGSHLYLDLNSGIGNFYIRDGTTNRYTFNDNGSFTATGNVTAYSDRRVKAQFEPIADALSKVQQLHGQTYIRTDMDDANRRYAGLIAQDVELVLPEAVSEVDDHLTLDYSGTIGLLVEAIKELKQEVNDLKAQLEDK